MTEGHKLYLGFDSSTQGLKATAVSADGFRIANTFAINYDNDLPHFSTKGGMHTSEGGARVSSPTLMWIEALDLLLTRMKDSGFPFEQVLALSGSGQQHGSVYWASGASAKLASLDSSATLANELSSAFARKDSPIWADSSTGAQCVALEAAVGGPTALATATGSRAYERFTGNQIARIIAEEPKVYESCERISLVSSFMCSVFLGKYAPIDTSDGAGTNLNDLLTEGGTKWYEPALKACASSNDLRSRLGENLVDAHTALGSISSYFIQRYGFSPDCEVIAWSGDNPCSLAGLGLQGAGDIAVSLGTSDTMFTVMGRACPGKDGHVFRNPVDPKSFMGMLVFKNGSLAREEVRDRVCGGDWGQFAQLLGESEPANNMAFGFYFPSPEITPTTGDRSGVLRYDSSGKTVESFDPATEVRAVVEGKFLAMRHFGQGIGMDASEMKRIIATGGASNNVAVLQVLADVFGVPVLTLDQSDSASLGAAFRAGHGHICKTKGFTPFAHVLGSSLSYSEAAKPSLGAREKYDHALTRFGELQETALKELQISKKRKCEEA